MKLSFIKFGKNQEQINPAGHAMQDIGQEQPILGLSDLYIPEDNITEVESPLGSRASEEVLPQVRDIIDVLIDIEELSVEQSAKARKEQALDPNCDIEKVLTELGVNEEAVLKAKAKLYGMDFVHIEPDSADKDAFEKLDIEFIKSSFVCPIAIEHNKLVIATNDPTNILLIEDVKRRTQMEVRVVVGSQDNIKAICNFFESQNQSQDSDLSVDDILSDMEEVQVVQDHEDALEDLEQMAGQSPVIKFVNYLISNAIREGASDIHVEPKEKNSNVRYRIDGLLFEAVQPPAKMHPAIVSRIKIMANLDISERRLPQDGKISVVIAGRAIDLRISTLPTTHGEKVVIRVLDSKSIMLGLEQLGMETKNLSQFREQIDMPHGIMLVTGPTGSGKSTTLYSAIAQMDGKTMNISTVEDPVEYELDFCTQVHVNEKIGMTFSSALRSLLRQDPDIIMIGEIRDNETARIAVQAALTGHLVLSTLHTNDAPSSITRLVNIGIDPYLIAASLNSVLAQRLVRKVCSKCKEVYKVPDSMQKYIEQAGIKPDQLFHGVGCEKCRKSGYSGRVGIYEFLLVEEKFRDQINKDHSVSNMRRVYQESGQPTLFLDGIEKVKQGLTTIEEVLRVTEVYGQTSEEEFTENM